MNTVMEKMKRPLLTMITIKSGPFIFSIVVYGLKQNITVAENHHLEIAQLAYLVFKC